MVDTAVKYGKLPIVHCNDLKVPYGCKFWQSFVKTVIVGTGQADLVENGKKYYIGRILGKDPSENFTIPPSCGPPNFQIIVKAI